MKNINKAFSIIEVIAATVVLTIAVFWVFKLIWENQKIINNYNNSNTSYSLLTSFRECIKNNSWSISDNQKFYIWLENCNLENTQTWIILNNINYILYWSWIWNNNYDLYIISDFGKIKEKFVK